MHLYNYPCKPQGFPIDLVHFLSSDGFTSERPGQSLSTEILISHIHGRSPQVIRYVLVELFDNGEWATREFKHLRREL
jgi:hypothetical protein